MITVWNLGQQQCSARLRNRLDDQNSRHDWQAGKVSLNKWLIDRNVLDRHNSLLALEINYTVNQQKRIAMRQNLENVVNIQPNVLRPRRGSFRILCGTNHSVLIRRDYTLSHAPGSFRLRVPAWSCPKAIGYVLRVLCVLATFAVKVFCF